MSDLDNIVARLVEHQEAADTRHGELMAVVSRIDAAIRGNGQPGLRSDVAELRGEVDALEGRCSSCPNAVAITELRARVDERQTTLAEIAPVQASRIQGRAQLVVGLLTLIGTVGAGALAWHASIRATQALQRQEAPPQASVARPEPAVIR